MIKAGIYSFRCLANGKIYIGSAVNLLQRRSNHFSDLRCQRHPNIHLQRCFNKYGEQSIFWEVIEIVEDLTVLLTREQYYIDHYEAAKPVTGLNIHASAASRRGTKAREETRQKLREAWKRRKVNFPITAETRAKLSASGMGRKQSQKAKDGLARANAKRLIYGDSDETRRRRREAWVRRKASPNYEASKAWSRVPVETINEMVRLYKEGFTSTQIAPMIQMSGANIRVRLHKAGVELRPKGSRPSGRRSRFSML